MNTESIDKTRERRIRQKLARAGLLLQQSRAREPHFDDRRGYLVVNAPRNAVVVGERFDWTLDDIEAWIADAEARDAAAFGPVG